MRFCHLNGAPVLDYKGTIELAPKNVYPWFEVPSRKIINANIVFGHWSALQGKCSAQRVYALDTGCVWGGSLTALRLQDYQRFSVDGLDYA